MGYPPPPYFSVLKLAGVQQRPIETFEYQMDKQHRNNLRRCPKLIAMLP